MARAIANDPALVRFRAVMGAMYGARLDRVLLFGSRARGDARADSDYDLAVFLTTLPDRWVELDRLADFQVAFFDQTGLFIDAKPYPTHAYGEASPLMREIRRDGVQL